ncbi:origin recognition complex subunit 2 [Cherax quadricarinatus]|nr:origin recognition complex subunit 2-like [Cherax quadricarinatus]
METRAKSKFSVTFVDDNLVEKITNGTNGHTGTPIPLSQRGSGRLTMGSRTSAGDTIELPPLQEMDEEVVDIFYKPTELLGESPLKGSSVFGFCTPKKKWGMLEKAESVKKKYGSPSTPKTPKSSLKQYPSTPTTPKRPSTDSKSGFTTPRSTRRLSGVVQEVRTPYSFRKKVKQRINKIVFKEDSSSSDEEDDDDDDDDSSYSLSEPEDESKENIDFQEECIKTPGKTPKRTPLKHSKILSGTPGKKPTRVLEKGGRGRKIKDVEMVGKADDYFTSNGDTGKVVTSDHTLSRLETPRLSPEALQSILSSVATSHQREREALLEEHMHMFPRWMTFLCEGFSVFLYGLGSKKQLISKFQQEYLAQFDHIVVNGFFPSLTLKNLLNNITEDIIDHTGSFHSIQEQLEFIQGFYTKSSAESLFIIIHNLDGPMLRGEKSQSAIAHLASIPHVHILASIDHINAPLIFDSSRMSHYNALWCDATTLAPYSEETSFENSLLVQQSGSLALSSLIHVFRSLTPNAKGIFLLLAQHQLDQKDNSNYIGLSFNDMYQRCRELFLVNSDLTLRAQLTEFRDHKLIRSKKGLDGIENLVIPLDSNILHDFINQQESDKLS